MKRTVNLLVFLIISSHFCISQIKTISKPKQEKKEIGHYDSLSNFVGSKYNLLKGQKLFLKCKKEAVKGLGIDGYSNFYSNIEKSTTYHSDGSLFSSSYEKLANNYFTIIDIISMPNQFFKDEFETYFKLYNETLNDTAYFKYDSEFELSFPFIIVGYFEKYKQSSINKQFVCTIPKGNKYIRMGKYPNYEEIKVNRLSTWICIDVVFDENSCDLAFILKNSSSKIILQKLTYELGYFQKK